MAIKFSCPSCNKALAVKEDLAGKQGRCPNCKQVIVIPTAQASGIAGRTTTADSVPKPAKKPAAERKPSGGSKVDLESLAAEVLVEKKQEAPAEPQTVTFTCPWCDSEVTYSAELAGKQAPCTNPECRRIIKIPALQKTEPRDWRKPEQSTVPSGARRDDAPLDGAWGSQHASGASRQALIEAKVIKEEREPITVRGWILRAAAAASLVLVLVAAVYFVLSYMSAGREATAWALAQSGLNDAVAPSGRVWLHIGLAEYALRTNRRNESGYSLALYHAHQAYSVLGATPPESLGRSLALAELLSLQQQALSLPSPDTESRREQDEWAGLFGETLNLLPSSPARYAILRSLARRQIDQPDATRAFSPDHFRNYLRLAFRPIPAAKAQPDGEKDRSSSSGEQAAENDLVEQINAVAVLAQEMIRGGQGDVVQPWIEELRKLYKPDHSLPIELVALLTALNQPELEAIKEGEPAHVGRFLGLVRAGRAGEAERYLNDHLQQSTTALKLSALLDAAEVLGPDQGEVAGRLLREAGRILQGHAINDIVWERYRFLVLTAQIDGVEAAESEVPRYLEEPDATYARAALVKLRCEIMPNASPSLPQELQLVENANDAQARWAMVAARCRAKGDPDGALNWAKSLTSPQLRACAGAGVLLSLQDRGGR
jgi:DNA-directed RNA polymerase subunit M/transcription elongation factor TFIIS